MESRFEWEGLRIDMGVRWLRERLALREGGKEGVREGGMRVMFGERAGEGEGD